MEKKNDPSLNGSPSSKHILPYFGSARELSESEYFELRIASMTPYRESEPRSITKARNRLKIAQIVINHFQSSSLPPIFDSFEYEGLRLKGVA